MKTKKLLNTFLAAALITPGYLMPLLTMANETESNSSTNVEAEGIWKVKERDMTQGFFHIHFEDENGKAIDVTNNGLGYHFVSGLNANVLVINDWDDQPAAQNSTIKINEYDVKYIEIEKLFSQQDEEKKSDLLKVLISQEDSQVEIEPYLFLAEDGSVRILEKDVEMESEKVNQEILLEKGIYANEAEMTLVYANEESVLALFNEGKESEKVSVSEEAISLVHLMEMFTETLTSQDEELTEEEQVKLALDEEERLSSSGYLTVKWASGSENKSEQDLIAYQQVALLPVEDIELTSDVLTFTEAKTEDEIDYFVEGKGMSYEQIVEQLPEEASIFFENGSVELAEVSWEKIEKNKEDEQNLFKAVFTTEYSFSNQALEEFVIAVPADTSLEDEEYAVAPIFSIRDNLWAWALDNGDGKIYAVGIEDQAGVKRSETGFIPINIDILNIDGMSSQTNLKELYESQINQIAAALSAKFSQMAVNAWWSDDESIIPIKQFTYFDINAISYNANKTENSGSAGLLFEVVPSFDYELSWHGNGKNWDNNGNNNTARYFIEVTNQEVEDGYLIDKPVYTPPVGPVEYSQIQGYQITAPGSSEGTWNEESSRTVIYHRVDAFANAGTSMANEFERSDYNPDFLINGIAMEWADLGMDKHELTDSEIEKIKETLSTYRLRVIKPSWNGEGWSDIIPIESVEYVQVISKSTEYPTFKLNVKSKTASWIWPEIEVTFYVHLTDDVVRVSEMTEKVEKDHIVDDENVLDPANTTVNFFDYWIDDQKSNDYDLYPTSDDSVKSIVKKGINAGRLFLFAGGWLFQGADTRDLRDLLGTWNAWTNNDLDKDSDALKAREGIVENTLKASGTEDDSTYPVLNLEGSDWNIPDALESTAGQTGKTSESLAYLFDPSLQVNGKASYPNVSGLFQVDNEGYFYFDSDQNFAELNANQNISSANPVKSDQSETDGNSITLYDTDWKLRNANGYFGGQFFPFNDWSNLFKVEGEEIFQAHEDPQNEGVNRTALKQLKDTENHINHYFGMTIETTFVQPVDGKIALEDDSSTDMIFEFSGDDDAWIFIDDVLVGDVGGIHDAVRVTINFATGEIVYESKANRSENLNDRIYKTTSIREMFEAAGKENAVDWNNDTFTDLSEHSLKFFYLERGNDVSNCSIKFNTVPVSAPNSGDLTVKKTVEEDSTGSIDTAESFHFKVELDDSSISGTYGQMKFVNGIAEFELQHNGHRTAHGLPVGIQYTVTETNSKGYTATYTGETGSIKLKETSFVSVVNSKEKTVHVELPETGGSGTILFYGAGFLVFLAAAGTVVLLSTRRTVRK